MKPQRNNSFKDLLGQIKNTRNTVELLVCVFPIQQQPCHNDIMAGKGLNLSDGCVAECVDQCTQEEKCTSSYCGNSEMYTPGTIANSQRIPTKINKNGAIPKVIILVEQVIL